MTRTTSRPLRLPRPLVRAIDSAVVSLLQPDPNRRIDFSRPPGEPALAGVDSVAWRVFRNPLSVFIGGVAAVVLELAEPSVRAGVWEHSSFRSNPLRRLQRTGLAAMVTVYGPRTQAERMIAGVVDAHDRVRGVTAAGVPYLANDARLLDWVQATATFGFVEAYRQFVHPLAPTFGLRPAERILLRRAGAWTDSIVLPSSPAPQACHRLGVPPESLLH